MAARCLTAVLIAVSLLPQIAHAGGPAPGSGGTRTPFSVQARGAGLVMTLFLPGPVFPQDALARATVRLWNSTSTPMQVQEPTVNVLWPSGRTAFRAQQGAYPAQVVSVSPPFRLPTSAPPPTIIGPHQAIARHVFVIIRTGRLQAVVAFGHGPSVPSMLRTPVLLARLERGLSPRITFGKQGRLVVATIMPASKQQLGGLWYMSALRCESTWSGTVTWVHAPTADLQPDGSYRLPAPGCRNPSEWHLVAGWLSQPLGAGNYSSQPGQ